MNDKVVKVGQLWQDNDPRVESWTKGGRRLLRVIAVGQPGVHQARVVSWYEVPDGQGGFRRMGAERPSAIKLARFRPDSTGYRLIQEAGDVRDSAERSDPAAVERVARAIHDERHGARITPALADALWEDPEVREQAYALARAAFRGMGAGVRGSAEERSDPSKSS